VEHYEWMNEEVRKEIEDLQRTYGFDEDEALAYWHLRHAGTLLLAMRRTDTPERSEQGEESVRLARAWPGWTRSSCILSNTAVRTPRPTWPSSALGRRW
jgi:hypothetical protein